MRLYSRIVKLGRCWVLRRCIVGGSMWDSYWVDWLLVDWLLVTGYWLLVIGYWFVVSLSLSKCFLLMLCWLLVCCLNEFAEVLTVNAIPQRCRKKAQFADG
jgi:hypothetical protein